MLTRSSSVRTTRSSSVLGKRPHHPDPPTRRTSNKIKPPPTPDPTPKRPRVSIPAVVEGDWNKENIAPFANAFIARDDSPITTPSRTRIRHSLPATPTSQIALSTPPPTPSPALQPLPARARALLRPTCNTSLAGRDTERGVIEQFVCGSTHALYISGSPGTGKTALVNSVLSSLSPDELISINCMALTTLDELWARLFEELGGGAKKGHAKGREAVLEVLTDLSGRCILVLDELDHIASTPTSLVSIFSLPSSSSLRIIGIANTHTLTSSHMSKRIQTLHFAPYTPTQLLDILHARLGPLFTTSEGGEAEDGANKFLPRPTLTLLAKKVAAQTGDVRSLFEVLRGAIDLASSSHKDSDFEEHNPLNTPTSVTPTHILVALKAHAPSSPPTRFSLGSSTFSTSAGPPARPGAGTNSETATKVRNLNFQAQLVLLSILLASKRFEAGLPLSPSSPQKPKTKPRSPTKPGAGIETTALHAYYTALLTRAANEVFVPASRSEFGDLVGMLEVVGLARLGSSPSSSASASPSPRAAAGGKRSFGRSASFGGVGGEVKIAEGVRTEEVLRGLGVGGDGGDVRAEEICAVWERERVRLGRDVRVLEVAVGKGAGKGVFVDAMED